MLPPIEKENAVLCSHTQTLFSFDEKALPCERWPSLRKEKIENFSVSNAFSPLHERREKLSYYTEKKLESLAEKPGILRRGEVSGGGGGEWAWCGDGGGWRGAVVFPIPGQTVSVAVVTVAGVTVNGGGGGGGGDR